MLSAKHEGRMTKKPSMDDFARVRAILQREDSAGRSFDEAVKMAAQEEPGAVRRIVESPDADRTSLRRLRGLELADVGWRLRSLLLIESGHGLVCPRRAPFGFGLMDHRKAGAMILPRQPRSHLCFRSRQVLPP